MDIINELMTNLGAMLDGIIADAPTKEIVKPSFTSVVDTTEVEEAWSKLSIDIFHFFKANKRTANMKDLREHFKDQLNFINSNIKAKSVKIVKAGEYVRAFYGSTRIAQMRICNKKLQPNERGEGFMIWTMLGFITCNGKTELCSKFCYNIGRSFNDIVKLKCDCLILTMLDCFEDVIEKILEHSPHGKTYVRIHEDGDFYNMEYFNKWLNLAKRNKSMVFEAYTKDFEVLEKINDINENYSNMVLRYSIVEDTKKEVIQYVKENNLLNYTVVGKHRKDKNATLIFEKVQGKNKCANDCKYCKKCYSKEVITIVNKVHY